jgi:hypothetical protein
VRGYIGTPFRAGVLAAVGSGVSRPVTGLRRDTRCARPTHLREGGPTKDVVVGNLDGIEAEGPQRLDEDDQAGDDRGRSIGVQSPHVSPLGIGERGEVFEDLAARGKRHEVAVYFCANMMLQI